MSESFVLEAETRSDLGKGASRRLRHAGKVPAILYGAGKDPVALTLNHNEIIRHLDSEAFLSHILSIKIGSGKEQAIVKDMQRHPARPRIMHMDLQRVSASEKIRVHVPLHFLHEEDAPGVKEGGLINHHATEVEMTCLPKDLPEFVEVDMGELELDGIIHLSDIKLPAGVEAVELAHGDGHDQTIVTIHMPRAVKEVDIDTEAEAESGEAAAAEEGGEDQD